MFSFVLLLLTFIGGAWAAQLGASAQPVDARTAARMETLRALHDQAGEGNPIAQQLLGSAYYSGGLGALQDYDQAVKWLRLAAEQKESQAQTLLGIMYARGEGVAKNVVIAHMWFNLAAAQGDENAKRLRSELAGELSAAQIQEAHKLAREWRPVR